MLATRRLVTCNSAADWVARRWSATSSISTGLAVNRIWQQKGQPAPQAMGFSGGTSVLTRSTMRSSRLSAALVIANKRLTVRLPVRAFPVAFRCASAARPIRSPARSTLVRLGAIPPSRYNSAEAISSHSASNEAVHSAFPARRYQ